jgi:putative phosphoesterase
MVGMATKLGLVSDVHAMVAPLRRAFEVFEAEGVKAVICAGDITGYNEELRGVVEILTVNNCWVIRGNHDARALRHAWPQEKEFVEPFFSRLPNEMELIIDGLRVYVVHASPPHSRVDGIDLLDFKGEVDPEKRAHWEARLDGFDHDVLIVGHIHRRFAETLADTLVVNPGSTCFSNTCATLTLPDRQVKFFHLDE